ncbi:MAG: Sua5/YciO/YrdC/YwlC family protein [Gemmataceae bacterium]
MTELLDWGRVERPDQMAASVAAFLRRGGLVAFPTESGALAVGAALRPGVIQRLGESVGPRPLELLLSSVGALRDWLPEVGASGVRLARRFWPGPLKLVGGDGVDRGLASRLPPEVRNALTQDGQLHLVHPAHEILHEVLRHLSEPMIAAPVFHGQAAARNAQQVHEATAGRLDLLIEAPSEPLRPVTLVELRGDEWRVQQEGGIRADDLRALLATLIVFVCTGNTCRSPLAEVLCKRRLAERLGCGVEELEDRGYQVVSAGLAAGPGAPAAVEAIEVARALGLDLTRHQSRQLTRDLVARADHLLVMTRSHLRALHGETLAGGGRPILLSPAGDDVSDPIGGTRDRYEACARQLDEYIGQHLSRFLPRPENRS